jgi:hypothetical protein
MVPPPAAAAARAAGQQQQLAWHGSWLAAAGNSGRRTYEDQQKIADMSEFDQ